MARRRGVAAPPFEGVPPGTHSRLGGFLNPSSEKMIGNRRGKPLSDLEVQLKVAEHRASTGNWDDADGRVFVGLHALCHRLVYGTLPLELESKPEFSGAARLALSILHSYFDDNADSMATFVKWAWERERSRAEYARGQGFDRNRLGARLLFSARLITDYRAARPR